MIQIAVLFITDIPKSYRFAYDIAAIHEAGIIMGFDDKTFHHEEEMTRNEMVAILHHALHTKTSVKVTEHMRTS